MSLCGDSGNTNLSSQGPELTLTRTFGCLVVKVIVVMCIHKYEIKKQFVGFKHKENKTIPSNTINFVQLKQKLSKQSTIIIIKI